MSLEEEFNKKFDLGLYYIREASDIAFLALYNRYRTNTSLDSSFKYEARRIARQSTKYYEVGLLDQAVLEAKLFNRIIKYFKLLRNE